MAALTRRTNSFGLVWLSASQFRSQWRRSSSMCGNASADAMAVAIDVLPAPDVPTTTTRMSSSHVFARTLSNPPLTLQPREHAREKWTGSRLFQPWIVAAALELDVVDARQVLLQ